MKSKFFLPLFFIAILLTGVFSSCKKNNDNNSDDLKAKIVGKWNYLKNVNHSVVNGTEDTETENDKPGNYWQFNNDGSFKAGLDDGEGGGTWSLTGNKISFLVTDDHSWDGILWDIQTLTANQLVLHAKQTTGQGYYEATIYMSR